MFICTDELYGLRVLWKAEIWGHTADLWLKRLRWPPGPRSTGGKKALSGRRGLFILGRLCTSGLWRQGGAADSGVAYQTARNTLILLLLIHSYSLGPSVSSSSSSFSFDSYFLFILYSMSLSISSSQSISFSCSFSFLLLLFLFSSSFSFHFLLVLSSLLRPRRDNTRGVEGSMKETT